MAGERVASAPNPAVRRSLEARQPAGFRQEAQRRGSRPGWPPESPGYRRVL